MKKIILFLIIFLMIANCSFNTSSELWEYKNSKAKSVNNIKILNETLNFNDYKKKIINYSYNSTFPDINN